MEEKLNEVPINDNEEPKVKKSQQFFWTKPKKMLAVLICAIIVLIVYIICILPYIGSPEIEVKDIEHQPNPGPQPTGDKGDFLGKIYCLYTLKENNEANFLSEKFTVPDNVSIYVDNIEISNKNSKDSNLFKLNGKGIHNVTFALYQEIDMKNMFNLI